MLQKFITNKKYIFDLGSSYLVILLNIIIPIILTPYLLEKLGTELYGLWILLSTIIVYFQLSNFGINTSYLKEISKKPNQKILNEYTNTTLFFLLFCAFIVGIIFTGMLLNLENIFIINENTINTAQWVFTVLFFIFALRLLATLFDAILFAYGFLSLKNFIIIFTTSLTAILTYVVLELGYSLFEIALIHFFFSFLTLLIYLLVSIHVTKIKLNFKYFKFDILISLLKPSLHYFVISVAIMVSFYSDNVVISSFISLSAVAIYSVAYKVVNISEKILFKIVDIMFPSISKLFHEKKYDELLIKHNKILLISLGLGFIGYGTLYFFGISIIHLWVGEEYTVDTGVFYFLLAFAFIHIWNHVSSVFVMAAGFHREVSYSVILEAILNVTLSIILLKYYGLMGVAMGTFFAHLVTNNWFATFWFYKNIYRLKKETT